MQDSVLQILFLGENAAWEKLSEVLAQSPSASLCARRLDSPAELFHALAVSQCHAVALDVHARNVQDFHFVEKVRAEHPSLPILALYSSSATELEAKANTSGASFCLPLDLLSLDLLRTSLLTCLAVTEAQSHLQKGSQMDLSFNIPDSSAFPASKNQLITHALNNLLCVISANAEILADQLQAAGPDARPLVEIKKAAQSAAVLMRQLK
jgi:DNA-binding NarL/FixJ family response regulator